MTVQGTAKSGLASVGWRTPAVILICGCLISLLAFGPRSALGFFLTPMSQTHGWGRDVFALAQHFSFNFDIAGSAYGQYALGGKFGNPTM